MLDKTLYFPHYPAPISLSLPPRLLDQIGEAIRIKHFRHKTEPSYVHYVRDFILVLGQTALQGNGAAEIEAYLSHMAIDRNVALVTQAGSLPYFLGSMNRSENR